MKKLFLTGLAVLVSMGMVACSGGDGPTEPPGNGGDNGGDDGNNDQVAQVEIQPQQDTVDVGSSVDFDATATNDQGDIVQATFTWISQDSQIATVDNNGTATGQQAGQTLIVAEADNGVRDTADLVVQDTTQQTSDINLRALDLDLRTQGVLVGASPEADLVVSNTGSENAGSFAWTVRDSATNMIVASGRSTGLQAGRQDTLDAAGAGSFSSRSTRTLIMQVDTDQEITESDEGDNQARRRLEVYPPGYDIELQFQNNVEGMQTIRNQRARWERIITSDLQDINPNNLDQDACFPDGDTNLGGRNDIIDDLLFLVRQDSIDGSGNTLAQTRVCFVRINNADTHQPPLPLIASMVIDTADIQTMQNDQIYDDVILHEMGHAVGIGTLWDFQGNDGTGPYELVSEEADSNDPRFIGGSAVHQYHTELGGGDTHIAVATTGGSGTAGVHWRESEYDNELMTGFIAIGSNPLSVMSVGSVGDLFYAVDFSEADSYLLPVTSGAASQRRGISLKNDFVFDVPLHLVTPQGRVQDIIRPFHHQRPRR